MRISLLNQREDFYRILSLTLNSIDFVPKKPSESKFYVNEYLNFISASSLKNRTFKILELEYSNSRVRWKKILQKVYVRLAISSVFRNILSTKSIMIPSHFVDFLILGGNHRLRLFSSNLNSSIVVLKNGERHCFVKNDIFLRSSSNLFYAPRIISSGEFWFEEEYFEGTPINRIDNEEKKVLIIDNLINAHWDNLLKKSNVAMSLKEYKRLVNDEVLSIINDKSNLVAKKQVDNIKDTFLHLLEKLDGSLINVSWTHGDFQEANILVDDNGFKVIDWESSAKRYHMYDFFTLLGESRTGILISDSLEKFLLKRASYNFFKNESNNEIILLLIEELRFSVNEEFSSNFYLSGVKTMKLCVEIKEYLNN